MENKISFCITYYNQKNFVQRSLESVFGLDIPCPFEILIGDDGSNDGTVEILEEYKKKYPDIIKIFYNEQGGEKSIGRASKNRLRLFEKAVGDYILFLDGDDFYIDKNFIKEGLKTFQNGVGAVAFNFKYVYKNKDEIYPKTMKEGQIKPKTYISKKHYTHTGAIIFKNPPNKNFNILNKINNFDDNAITIYMLQFGDLYYIDKPVLGYFQDENGLWGRADIEFKNLISALDYKKIAETAPKFEPYILKRQYSYLRFLYKNKGKIQAPFEIEDNFISNLINWNSLSFIEKLKIRATWAIMFLRAKL